MRVDQILAGFAEGDAISHEALIMRDIFRGWGLASDIFVDPAFVSPAVRQECLPLKNYKAESSDVCIHHYGIASSAQFVFLDSPAKKILIYHNITPAEFFKPFDDKIFFQLTEARKGLVRLASIADAVWADSMFNASELIEAGIRDVKILKLPLSTKQLNLTPDVSILNKFSRHKLFTFLFVGRIAPNKNIEELIKIFAYYHNFINPFSRLVIVGSFHGVPRYMAMLRMLIGDLDISNVCFEGFASPEGLIAYYKIADVYVSTTNHEGYCLPLLEAMYFDLPVITKAKGGVNEAMGGAGVMYDDLPPSLVAELIYHVFSNTYLKNEVLSSQKIRIKEELQRDFANELRRLMMQWL